MTEEQSLEQEAYSSRSETSTQNFTSIEQTEPVQVDQLAIKKIESK